MFLLLLLALLPAQGADAIALQWQFKQGDTFLQTTTSKVNQLVKIGSQDFPQEVHHTTVIRYTVKEVAADKSVTLEQKIESIKATNPDGTPVAGGGAVLNQLQGATFTSKLGPDRLVLQLEGHDELLKRLAGDDPSVRRVVQAMVSESQLKKIINESFGFLPPAPVKPGAAWQRELPLTLGPLGSAVVKQDYRFEGLETRDGKSLAKITFKPTIVYTPAKGEASNPGMSITAGTIHPGESHGTLYFDAAAGRLDRADTRFQLKGELTVKLDGKDSPLTFEHTQTVEVRISK